MKRLLVCGLMFSALAGPAMAAESSVACAAKRSDIESQLSEARARHRKQEIAGLEKALRANKATCTDASLARERDKDIRQAREKVAERERSLAEAERKHDARKIADRRAKLEEARRELARAERPIRR